MLRIDADGPCLVAFINSPSASESRKLRAIGEPVFDGRGGLSIRFAPDRLADVVNVLKARRAYGNDSRPSPTGEKSDTPLEELPKMNPNKPPSKADTRELIKQAYSHWLTTTGNAIAAATLALAEAQSCVQLPAQANPEPFEPNTSDHELLTLPEAADYLRYSPSALRRIAKRKAIQFAQIGSGPIKFRREWLDDYVAANASSPKDVNRSPARKKTTRRSVSSTQGLDPAFFKSNHES
ncbi:helix-turn-helix domain-containing protein [Aeoliella sp. ICT_H6.2]|uniref:Helix-turn-helix domain-containing protein n=1 Tax=Aeoliella straminimaris TaxID=2954799 RepID=A0A9X2JHX1_9BACT|nr:helix-turn-helix domain-containing protein [Aeoliella straminimaris]MCO6043349.1 helix-turn-helix domain-containing protein [Aeoliella straminimaris]